MQARVLSKSSPRFGFGWILCAALAAAMCLGVGQARAATGPMFDGLVLVDEINCGDANDPHPLTQSGGTSQIQSILGQPCRVMPPGGSARYFAYRIGQGKGLQAGKAYILTVDYPEDQPRAMFITNAGCETTEGIYSGNTVGDAYNSPYVMQEHESLALPLSGQYETWQQLFHLHGAFYQTRESGERPDRPEDGFMVVIAQFKQSDDPTSAGAAVSRIALYEAPNIETYTQPLNLPPDDLPRRAMFWREEMSDGVLSGSPAGVFFKTDWFEYKARLHKFLGMNCFSKDLLEFGHNQGWNPTRYGIDPADLPEGEPAWKANHAWYNFGDPNLWPNIVAMLENYDLDVMPFYEYAGSIGQVSWVAIGSQRRCRPLFDTNPITGSWPNANMYTHVYWSEKTYCDVTDPDFLEDVRRLLEITIVDHKDQVNMIGAWFRTRSAHWPVSFADAAIARFVEEANGGVAVTRADLQQKGMLYEDYLEWWNGKRHDYLNYIRDYLRGEGIDDAAVLFTWDASEGGTVYPDWGRASMITDDVATWQGLGKTTKPLAEAIADHYHYDAQTLPPLTWGQNGYTFMWEWEHACPRPDVWNYQDSDGVMMTHTFNKAYTVGDPYSMDMFRTASGLAMIRHYMLNEDAMGGNDNLLGYFVSDVNRTGPYTMLGEAWAMAYGDPRYIGYLASSSYNRGFPQYVRNFNAHFLALPALPSVVLENASDNPNVIVRAIDAGDYGTYLAVVNVGYYDAENVTISLPYLSSVTNAVTGESVPAPGGQATVSLYPCQLLALKLGVGNKAPTAYGQAVEGYMGEQTIVTLVATDDQTAVGNLQYAIIRQPDHGTLSLVGNLATYTPAPGYGGSDSFEFTATDDDSYAALASDPATVTVSLFREDGFGTRAESPEDLPVYIFIRGPGTGSIIRESDPAPGDPDIVRVILDGTTTASTLVVQGRDGLSIGEIVVNGSLGGIDARTTDVWGDIDVSGGTLTGRVNLRDLVGGTLTVGVAGGARDAIDLNLERVENYNVDSLVPIRSLSCYEWIDDAGPDDVISVPWLGRLTTRAMRANPRMGRPACSGDFQADLLLSGAGAPRGGAFGTGNIAGNLTEAIWQVVGGFGRLTVKCEMNTSRILSTDDIANVTVGSMRDSDIYAGVAGGALGLPDPLTQIHGPGSGQEAAIGSVTVRGMKLPGGWYTHNFVNSNIAACEIGNVRLCNADPDGVDDFGVAGYMAGRISYKDRDRESSWNWPARPGETAACGTPLTVDLLVADIDSFARQEQIKRDPAGDANYPFSDMTGAYLRVLGDWVFVAISTNQPVDQPGASDLHFNVNLDIDSTYPTLMQGLPSEVDAIISYDRDADRVTVYTVNNESRPGGAYGIVTNNGVIIAVPLNAFGSYEYFKLVSASIFQDWGGADLLMDDCQ